MDQTGGRARVFHHFHSLWKSLNRGMPTNCGQRKLTSALPDFDSARDRHSREEAANGLSHGLLLGWGLTARQAYYYVT